MNKLLSRYKAMSVRAKAALWFLICSFLQKGISVITTPIFTRLLQTTEYGHYNTFDSWLKILSIFISLHLYSGVFTQGLIKFSDDRKRYASSLQGLTLVLCLGWTVVYLLFRGYWNRLLSLTTVQMLAMLVMIWSSAAFNLWLGEKRVEYRYKKVVIATLIISVAKPVVGIICVKLATDKVTARILGLAVVELLGYAGFFIVQMKRGKQFYSAKYWKHALVFNLPLIPHYLSQTVLSSADRIMIRNMVGPGEAGIYSLAYQVSQIMTLFNQALSHTLSPWIYQKIKDRKAGDITKTAYLSMGIIACVNLGLIAVAPEAVSVFAPKAYHEAFWVVPPVAMSVLLMFSYDMFAKFQFYYEKTKFIMIASVTGAGLNILLNYIFIRQYGYYAAAYTTLFCYLIYVVAHYLFMRKIIREHLDGVEVYNTKTVVFLFLAFFAAGFGLMATYRHPAVRYAVIGAAAICLVVFRKKVIGIIKRLVAIKGGKTDG